MARETNERPGSSEKNLRNQDLEDSPRDKKRLSPDESTIDLPDVKDIPGQEHIHVPRMNEMADDTISSDDEEGTGLFEDDEEDQTIINMGTEDDIPEDDKVALENDDEIQNTDDDRDVSRATLDKTDFEGDELNEESDTSGRDLDVPGSEDDDDDEETGEEDEENNSYSQAQK
jgi:hypothetical protein